MKHLAILLLCLVSFQFAKAQDSTKTYSITVKINKVLSDKGHILMGLHDKNTFMKGKGIQNAKVDIVDGKCTYTFTDVTPGTYAVMVLHDANDNQKMDFADNGMPQENYGTSNNKMNFGPPQFSDAQFDLVDKDLELEIKF